MSVQCTRFTGFGLTLSVLVLSGLVSCGPQQEADPSSTEVPDLAAVLANGKCGTQSPASYAEGDLDGDGICTDADLQLLLDEISEPEVRTGDLNSDGVVDGRDFKALVELDSFDGGLGLAAIVVGDLDGDGDVDIFDAVLLQANMTKGNLRLIGDCTGDDVVDGADLAKAAEGYLSIENATWNDCDFDGDGDVDIFDLSSIKANNPTLDASVQWRNGDANKDNLVNMDDLLQIYSRGKFGTREASTWEDGDFNADGVVTIADLVKFSSYLDISVPRKPGDANSDGRVDVLDIVLVASAGKFGTGNSATWAEGDFNGDGKVTIFDLQIFSENLTKFDNAAD